MRNNNFVKNEQDIINVCETFQFPTLLDQRELVKRKLAIEKQQDTLSIFKYHRNVMYDYSWNKSVHLLECRGHVYDNYTGALVVAPPRKGFNYLENDWWSEVPLDTAVLYAKKYNGFLGCITSYGVGELYTTTGSLDSTFTTYIKETAKDVVGTHVLTKHLEIMHKNDPHIVEEQTGYALLNVRVKETGLQLPYNLKKATLGEVLQISKQDKGEGFMVYHSSDYMCLSPCKVKSPYYVGKKKLMRMHDKAIDKMYANPSHFAALPVQWKDAASFIAGTYPIDYWKAMDAQSRRKCIESEESKYFNFGD